MVEINEKDLEENNSSEPTEAEKAQEASITITEEIKQMQEQKEQKEISKPKTTSSIDLSKLNAFKDKVTKEFNLEEKIDSHGCCGLYYNGFIILKLLPRKNCWYGVWREVPENGNKWKAFRVREQADEDKTYEHIKLFIKTNAGV